MYNLIYNKHISSAEKTYAIIMQYQLTLSSVVSNISRGQE